MLKEDCYMQVSLMGFGFNYRWIWTAIAANLEGILTFFLLYTVIQVYINTHNCSPTDAKGEVALALLPTMLPPPVYKKGRRLVRASIDESRRAFMDVQPVSNSPLSINQNMNSFRNNPSCCFKKLEGNIHI